MTPRAEGLELNAYPSVIIDWFDSFRDTDVYQNRWSFLSNFYEVSADRSHLMTDALWSYAHPAVRERWSQEDFPTFRDGETPFQAMKAKHPGEFKSIMRSGDPGLAKAKGRRCSLRPDWEEIKFSVMREVLASKFSPIGSRRPGDPLSYKLLTTGSAYLVEGTFWGDTIWGVDLTDPERPGENWLGVLLMERRAELLLHDSEALPAVIDRLPYNGRRGEARVAQ